MKYSALLCLLLVVVSTDGLSVKGGWDQGTFERFRNELSVSISEPYIRNDYVGGDAIYMGESPEVIGL